MKRKQTSYLADDHLVITELSGELDSTDIEEWQRSLSNVLGQLKTETKFKILINLHGFKASTIEAHKHFREVVPRTLAGYGWYVGYLRMFPEAVLTINSHQKVYCVAAAHVHHDESKIRNYAENYSMRNERFFTDAHAARIWINSLAVEA